MRNGLDLYWWGVDIWLDEEHTQQVLAGADLAAIVGAFASGLSPAQAKLPVAAVSAGVKLDAWLIKQADERGGHHGVIVRLPWGPAFGLFTPSHVPIHWALPQTE